jgi:hypothetical protein
MNALAIVEHALELMAIDRMRIAAASILPTVVVVMENLSSNERVRIATGDPLARNHIVRLHANARTESITWVRLSIISYGRGLMRLE